MYIESLQIASFGSLGGVKIDLQDGINVISGNNESGKSTIAEFIRFVFYGFSGKADRERYASLSSGAAEGHITVNCGVKRYRIERRLAGVREVCSVIDLSDGSKCFENRVPGEVFFGIPSSLYSSTSFVGQTDGSKVNGKETAEAVDNLLFSADENVSVKKTLKKLDAARTELYHKNKKGGLIYDIINELSSLRTEYGAVSADNARIIELENSTLDSQTKLESDKELFKKLSFDMDEYARLETRLRNKKLSELEEEYRKADKKLSDFVRINTYNGFFPDVKYYDSLTNTASKYKNAEQRVESIEKRVSELGEEIRADEEQRENSRKEAEMKKEELSSKRGIILCFSVVLMILLLVSAAATALMLVQSKTVLTTVCAVLAVLFLTGMTISFSFVSKLSSKLRDLEIDVTDKNDIYHLKLENLREELTSAREEKAEHKEKLTALAGKWGVAFTSKLTADVKNAIETRRELENDAENKRYLYVNFKTDIERSQSTSVADDGSDIVLPENFDYKEAKRKFDFQKWRIESSSTELHSQQLELARLTARTVPSAKIEDKITAAEKRLTELNARFDAYMLAYESIEQASENMRASVSPRLSAMSGALMKEITGGRHSDIGVDISLGMSFVLSSENGGAITKDAEFMSAGTSDAAYICLRLSLLQLICGDKQPPVIFDESFARLDDDRLKNMLRLLASSAGQKLILTSVGREREILDAENTEYGEYSFN